MSGQAPTGETPGRDEHSGGAAGSGALGADLRGGASISGPPDAASPPATGRRWSAARWLPWALLLGLSVLARLPAFLNARGVHSDAAIVGLQARHILDGEWSWFLWGAGYQASFDAVLLALGFAITGPSALTLMVVPFIGHLLVTVMAYDLLRRVVPPWAALIACLPLVFAPQSINGVALYAPRQWSITAAFFAVWLAAHSIRRGRAVFFLMGSAFFAAFSIYLDLFTLQLLPGVGAFILACALVPLRPGALTAKRLLATAAGAAVGAAVLAWSRSQPTANAVKATLSLERVEHNWNLLVDTALPYLLGAKVFVPGRNLYPDLWQPPLWFRAIQIAGLAVVAAAFLYATYRILAPCRPPNPHFPTPHPTADLDVRRMGALGVAVTISSIAGFLVSSMPSDMWSTRYLAPIVWFIPFTFAPAAWRLSTRRFGIAVSPYVVATAVSGWLAFGPYVRGPLPVRTPRGVAEDEAAVAEVLRERGVEYAAAQFWLAYRLGFLFEEQPVVVPLAAWEDRYLPYREAFNRADKVALIFHPSEPRAHPAPFEQHLRRAGAKYERLEVRGFTLLIHHRR